MDLENILKFILACRPTCLFSIQMIYELSTCPTSLALTRMCADNLTIIHFDTAIKLLRTIPQTEKATDSRNVSLIRQISPLGKEL